MNIAEILSRHLEFCDKLEKEPTQSELYWAAKLLPRYVRFMRDYRHKMGFNSIQRLARALEGKDEVQS